MSFALSEPLTYRTPWGPAAPRLTGPGDGSIERGDREDTGDNEANLDVLDPGLEEANDEDGLDDLAADEAGRS